MTASELTRRRLLAATAAAAGGAAIPATTAKAAKPHRTPVKRADVVVVGAGLAGLSAARALAAAGRSVVVLEARERVGGRTLNHQVRPGVISEIGGQWIGPTQDHIAALAKDVGIGTYPTYDSGQNVYISQGQRSTFSDQGLLGGAPPDPKVLADIVLAISRLDQLSTQVPVAAPWTAANAELWDGQTVDTWVRENTVNPYFQQIASVAFEAILGVEARDFSLLYALFYIAAAGNAATPGTFERLFDVRGAAQDRRFVGGSQLVSIAAAHALGRRVVLGSPVRRIVWKGPGCKVVSDKLTVNCKKVIVAIPPAMAGRIAYEPVMPMLRDQLCQRMPMGSLMKCEAVYDRPFWRADGLTGQGIIDTGPAKAIFDNTPPEGSPGILLGFVGGDALRAWSGRTLADRRAAVLNNFAQCFGAEALKPTGYFEQDWSREQWTGGCPVGVASPGALLRFGRALRDPIGPIHWAGTETATYWNGYMDGAVSSGLRAAGEV